MVSNTTRRPAILLVAALLLVVGIGNVLIGYSKGVYYTETLLEASRPSTDHPYGKYPPDSLFVKSLRSHAHYYDIVRGGGIVLMLSGIALGLVYAVRRRSRQPHTGSCRSTEDTKKH